jgi:hypothetical protein
VCAVEVAIGLALVVGAAAVVGWFVLDRWGGLGSRQPARGEPAEDAGGFVVRTYEAHTQRDAISIYVEDADVLAARGYVPVGQSWGDGQWDGGLFLLALLLSLFGIGLIVLAYMAIIRPDGTLCVTYERRGPEPV